MYVLTADFIKSEFPNTGVQSMIRLLHSAVRV